MEVRMIAELVTRELHGAPAEFLGGRDIPVEEEGALESAGVELRDGDVELRTQRVVIREHDGRALAVRPGELRLRRQAGHPQKQDLGNGPKLHAAKSKRMERSTAWTCLVIPPMEM